MIRYILCVMVFSENKYDDNDDDACGFLVSNNLRIFGQCNWGAQSRLQKSRTANKPWSLDHKSDALGVSTDKHACIVSLQTDGVVFCPVVQSTKARTWKLDVTLSTTGWRTC